MNQFKEIRSNWDTSYWDGSFYSNANVNYICRLSNVKITYSVYKSKAVPKWQIPYGFNPSLLMSPNGIAILTETNHIFVSDDEGKRIQVFSQTGEHTGLIDTTTNPIQIFFVNSSNIYGFSKDRYKNTVLTEVNMLTLARRIINCPIKEVVKFAYGGSRNFFTFSRVGWPNNNWTVNKIFLDIASDSSPEALILPCQASMVKDENSTTINSPIKLVDITTEGNIVYLLVSNNEYLVMEFNTRFKLIRSICPSLLLGAPRAICVDEEANVIIAGDRNVTEKLTLSDSDLQVTVREKIDTQILILTSEGEMIHEIIHTSENCVGIAVNSNFDIFVLNNDTSYPLTAL